MEIRPDQVHDILRRHILVDGLPLVLDLERSRGLRMVDARTGDSYLDLMSFTASLPLGMNHPALTEPEFLERLTRSAIQKPSNSDLYTVEFASFVETFARLAAPPEFAHFFFISGGTLGVENALKAAFDWKVRRNFSRGQKKERGHQVIHFREAFHGRSGYTLSLTNTDPTKVDLFPKFDWPRVPSPKIVFPLEGEHLRDVEAREAESLAAIRSAIDRHGDDIAAILIEPIQGEGGDNHFRPEFFRALRQIADEEEILLVFDEVQTGIGLTGKMWCFEHLGVVPDLVSFGKKAQVAGCMSTSRIDEVENNVFELSSRLNSTWGGNLTDMVRAERILEVIDRDQLLENTRQVGAGLLEGLRDLAARFPDRVSNVRGRGLFCAFDCPDTESRDQLLKALYDERILILGSGERSIRFRPPLVISPEEAGEAVETIARVLDQVPCGK